jgi:inosine-uridine nucleoside N-ribohydrolase
MNKILFFCMIMSGATIMVGETAASQQQNTTKIPVILDTDIGDDIDDTWALGFLLRSPELDVKLVVGDQGNAEYRAKLIARFLQTAKRTDIPVGVGMDFNRQDGGRQAEWVKDYNLSDYPGVVYQDGVQAIIDTIMNAKERITLIAIGPLPNIAEALKREPKIAQKADFVGMHGSVRLGYGGNQQISAEYNVRAAVEACQKVFTAAWPITITPLDTCGLVVLKGERYKKMKDSDDPIAKAVIENYRIWLASDEKMDPNMADKNSSTLFDTVAVYLAFAQDFTKMEELGIHVTDDGYTKIDSAAKTMKVATEWKDMDAFEDLLVSRLTNSQ